jgi:hypothetical protein
VSGGASLNVSQTLLFFFSGLLNSLTILWEVEL